MTYEVIDEKPLASELTAIYAHMKMTGLDPNINPINLTKNQYNYINESYVGKFLKDEKINLLFNITDS